MVSTIEKNEKLLSLYLSASRIRLIELEISKHYPDQEMRCPTHLSIGQELAGALIGQVTLNTDYVVSTHRSHAHYLGKGGDLNAMVAELFGKSTGCSRGLGGSMHLIDKSVGFEASTAIVGNSLPVAVGIAKAIKLSKKKSICVAFIGDAVFETGVFYESMNLAATWKLPILFVCENNLYSVYSPLSVRQPEHRKNYKIVEAMGVKAVLVDGFNAVSALEDFATEVNFVRDSHLPCLIELPTYRWYEHCGPNLDNDIGYRTEDEYEEFKEKDVLNSLEKLLLDRDILSPKTIEKHQNRVLDEMSMAFSKARAAPALDLAALPDLEFCIS